MTFAPHATGKQIKTCQQSLSSANVTYYLGGDLNCQNWALTASAAGLTIDLGGHTLKACGTQSTFTRSDTIIHSATQPPAINSPSFDTVLMDGKGIRGHPNGSPFTIISISSVTDGTTTWIPGTDYLTYGPDAPSAGHGNFITSGWQINWNIAGHQPANGAPYTVNYTYSEPCAGFWYSAFEANMTGATSVPLANSNLDGITITNGVIDVRGAAPYSSGIHIYGATRAQITLSNLMILTDAPASSCALAIATNIIFKNIVCVSSGTKEYIRDHFDLSGILSASNVAPTLQYEISGVVDTGGGQSAIFNQAPNVNIHDNMLSNGVGTYSNDFQIETLGNGSSLYSNTVNSDCAKGQGSRGIGATTANARPAANISIHDNKFHVCEQPNNAEYARTPFSPVCEHGGTYGIQFDTVTSGSVYRNTVQADAKSCDAHGLRLTSIPPAATITTRNNTISASRIGNVNSRAYGLSCDDCEGGTVGNGDSFTGDSAAFFVDADGSMNFTVKGATLAKGSNPDANFHTITISQLTGIAGGQVCRGPLHCNATLWDVNYAGGAKKNDVVIGQTADGEPFDLCEDWSYMPTFMANGSPLSGATVTFTDAAANTNSYTTDSNGHLTGGSTQSATVYCPFNAAVAGVLQLPEVRYFNVASGNTPLSEARNPYSVSVTKSACATLKYELNVTKKTTEARSTTCP